MVNSFKRNRVYRSSQPLRDLLQEHRLHVTDLIYPLFITETSQQREAISSMPNIERIPLSKLPEEIDQLQKLGIKAVLLFGIPKTKDAIGSQGYAPDGIVQRAIRLVKEIAPDMIVIADTCLCEYTDHGHCGMIDQDGCLCNDQSLALNVKVALSQAQAGADIIAPSNCLDGYAVTIRTALDQAGFEHIPILGYSIKFASAFYGPFRDAANSAPQTGDRKSYQMPIANQREALRELQSDVEEGVALVMVKPAMSFMDIIYQTKQQTLLPVVAYNVSGEYSMIKAAAEQQWIDEKAVVMELMTSFKRAGADLIITYFAKQVAQWLQEDAK